MEVANRTGDEHLQLEAASALAKAYADSSQGHLSVEILEPVLERHPGDSPAHARALNELARSYMFQHQHEQCLATLDRALAIAEPLDMVRVVAGALNSRGVLLYSVGRPREGRALLEASRRLAEEHDLPYELRRALNNLAYMSTSDNQRDAIGLSEVRLELARRVNNLGDLFDALSVAVGNAYSDGDWGRHEELMAELDGMDLPERQAIELEDHRRALLFIREGPEPALERFRELITAYGPVERQIQSNFENEIAVMEFAAGRVEEAFQRFMAIADHGPNLFDVYGGFHAAVHLRDRDKLRQVRARFDGKVFKGRFIESFAQLITGAELVMDGRRDEGAALLVSVMKTWDEIFWRMWTAIMRAECALLIGLDHPAGLELGLAARHTLEEIEATTFLRFYAPLWPALEAASIAG